MSDEQFIQRVSVSSTGAEANESSASPGFLEVDRSDVLASPPPPPSSALPPPVEKQPISEEVFAEFGGVDRARLTLGPSADATITFLDEVARHDNVLGTYLIGEDGSISDPRIIFADADKASPGDAVALSSLYAPGTLSEGQEIGLFLVSDGADRNPERVFDNSAGSLRFIEQDGDPATVTSTAPELIFTSAGGGEERIVKGDIFHVTDAGSPNPGSNSLNDGGAGQVISGDTLANELEIRFEDLRIGGTGTHSDRDFNDLILTLQEGPDEGSQTQIVRNSNEDNPGLGEETAELRLTSEVQTVDHSIVLSGIFSAVGDVLFTGEPPAPFPTNPFELFGEEVLSDINVLLDGAVVGSIDPASLMPVSEGIFGEGYAFSFTIPGVDISDGIANRVEIQATPYFPSIVWDADGLFEDIYVRDAGIGNQFELAAWRNSDVTGQAPIFGSATLDEILDQPDFGDGRFEPSGPATEVIPNFDASIDSLDVSPLRQASAVFDPEAPFVADPLQDFLDLDNLASFLTVAPSSEQVNGPGQDFDLFIDDAAFDRAGINPDAYSMALPSEPFKLAILADTVGVTESTTFTQTGDIITVG